MTSAPAAETTDGKVRRNVTINVRATEYVRDIIDQAASIMGKSRSEFMLECARSRAEDVLLDQKLFALDDARYEEFVRILEGPAPAGGDLKSLLAGKAPWETQPR